MGVGGKRDERKNHLDDGDLDGVGPADDKGLFVDPTQIATIHLGPRTAFLPIDEGDALAGIYVVDLHSYLVGPGNKRSLPRDGIDGPFPRMDGGTASSPKSCQTKFNVSTLICINNDCKPFWLLIRVPAVPPQTNDFCLARA